MVTWMELEEKAAKLVKAELALQKLYDAVNEAGFAVLHHASGEVSLFNTKPPSPTCKYVHDECGERAIGTTERCDTHTGM